MVRVQMLQHITGLRNGKAWPPRGGFIELPQSEAEGLYAHGYAVPAPLQAEQPVERAVVIDEIRESATLKRVARKPKGGKQ